MKFQLMVCEVKEVEILDLSPELMQVLAEYGVQVEINYDQVGYSNMEGGEYAELMVRIADESLSDNSIAHLWAALRELPENTFPEYYDAGDGSPWFQSDGPDGYKACETWTEEMKKRYPGQIVQ